MRHPYSEALLASVPKVDQDPDERLLSIAGLPPDLSRPITNCRFAPRCQYATDRCREEDPPLDPVTSGLEPGEVHRFACFHPVDHSGPAAPVTIAAAAKAPAAASAESAEAPEILLVDHVVKEFPVMSGGLIRQQIGTVKAVSDVSFSIRRGETLAWSVSRAAARRPSGRLLVALERPVSGTIRFEGDEVNRLSGAALRHRRRDLQLMFQDPYASLDPRMRVGSIVREPLKVQRVGSSSEQKDRVQQLLKEVGLSPQAIVRYPHEFSGGQRQRIGLARALALDPKLIVADEPVSALDVSIQAQILNLMKDLQRRHDLTFVMISHDLAVVRYMSDNIGVMYLGKLVEVGPAAEVYDRPAHPYTRGLLDAVPNPEVGQVQRETAVRGELPSSVDPPSGCRFRTRCPRAEARCAEEEPPLTDFGAGHFAACHFPLQTPVQLTSSGTATGI